MPPAAMSGRSQLLVHLAQECRERVILPGAVVVDEAAPVRARFDALQAESVDPDPLREQRFLGSGHRHDDQRTLCLQGAHHVRGGTAEGETDESGRLGEEHIELRGVVVVVPARRSERRPQRCGFLLQRAGVVRQRLEVERGLTRDEHVHAERGRGGCADDGDLGAHLGCGLVARGEEPHRSRFGGRRHELRRARSSGHGGNDEGEPAQLPQALVRRHAPQWRVRVLRVEGGPCRGWARPLPSFRWTSI